MVSKWSIIAGFVHNEMKGMQADTFGGKKHCQGKLLDPCDGILLIGSDYMKEAKTKADERREEAYRLYNEERHAKQEKEEKERERARNKIRDKYGIEKKTSPEGIVRSQSVEDIQKKYSLSDFELKEFQQSVDGNEEIQNLKYRRIYRKLERHHSRQEENLKCKRQDSCRQQ